MHLMPDRLSPLDVSFLYLEDADDRRCTSAGWRSSSRPEGGLRLRPPGRADLGSGSPSCRATGSGSAGCRAGWPTRSGSTTRTSTSPTTCAGPRCRGRAPTAQLARAGRPGAEPPAGPQPAAVGDLPRRGPRPTAGSRSSPRPTTRWSTASAPSTSARSSSTRRPTPRESPPTTPGARAGAVLASSWWPARSPRPSADRPQAIDTLRGGLADAARDRRRGSPARPAGCSPPRARRAPGPRRQPAQRRRSASSAATRMAGDRPRRLQADPQGARRHRQRRRARDGRRRAAGLAADPRRDGRPGDDRCARWCRSASAPRTRTAAAATGSPAYLRRPAGRRGRARSMRLHQVSYAMRAHKESGQAVGADALVGLAGFAPPTLHSLGARVASGCRSGCSTWSSPTCPARSSRCTPRARGCWPCYPVVPLGQGPGGERSG